MKFLKECAGAGTSSPPAKNYQRTIESVEEIFTVRRRLPNTAKTSKSEKRNGEISIDNVTSSKEQYRVLMNRTIIGQAITDKEKNLENEIERFCSEKKNWNNQENYSLSKCHQARVLILENISPCIR